MTQIKEIGYFCRTDKKGYIMNDSKLKHIDQKYLKVVEETVELYRSHLKEDLHSVYIRGSLPRGLGIENVSDLDTIAVTNKNLNNINLKWVDKAEQHLSEKYSCLNGVEFNFHYAEKILNTSHFSIIPFMIKTHSVCIYGDDLSVYLPKYKADKTLGNEHLIHLKGQIELAKQDLVGNDDEADILDCCEWIMKIIVRAGLALVIEQENKYTRDLFPACNIFSAYYPEKKSDMEQAVKYAIAPVKDPNEILSFLNKMGGWMIKEANKWLDVYNPRRESNMKI